MAESPSRGVEREAQVIVIWVSSVLESSLYGVAIWVGIVWAFRRVVLTGEYPPHPLSLWART